MTTTGAGVVDILQTINAEGDQAAAPEEIRIDIS